MFLKSLFFGGFLHTVLSNMNNFHRFILPIEETLKSINTQSQSGPGSNGN